MALTKADLGQISEIVSDAIHGAVSGLATKDELHTSIHGAVSGLATKDELDSVKHEIRRVRLMLEEDYSAETDRVTRLSRRLDRTRAELKQHIASTTTQNQT